MKWSQSELFNLIKNLKSDEDPTNTTENVADWASEVPPYPANPPHASSPDPRPPVAPPPPTVGKHLTTAHTQTNFATLYNKNMDDLNRCIHVAGNAISTLDTIEARLLETRNYVANLSASNIAINEDTAREFIAMFADQVNALISELDREEPNMLRDSRVQIRFVELGGEQSVNGIDLTLISIEKLVAFKLQSSAASPSDWVAFFDTMSSIVKNNVQIISSIMLALIASREYTANISDFALRENIIGPQRPNGQGTPIKNTSAQRFFPSRTSEITRNMPSPFDEPPFDDKDDES